MLQIRDSTRDRFVILSVEDKFVYNNIAGCMADDVSLLASIFHIVWEWRIIR